MIFIVNIISYFLFFIGFKRMTELETKELETKNEETK